MFKNLFNKKQKRSEERLKREIKINDELMKVNLKLIKNLADELSACTSKDEIEFIGSKMDEIRAKTTELVLINAELTEELKEL